MRHRCVYCGRIAHKVDGGLMIDDWDGCPKHPRPHTVLPVEPVDGRAVTLGGTYCHEYIKWPWWKPAWLWIRGTVLWPFFKNEILVRAGKIMTKRLEKKE